MSWVTQYVIAAAVFCLVDFIWLTTIAEDMYDRYLGDLMAPSPNVAAAVLFYAIFIAGLVFFVIRPALVKDSWKWAAGAGAFFGLVTYATWDLTNLSVLRDFPSAIVPIDLAWGAFLAASVSAVTYAVVQRLPEWARA